VCRLASGACELSIEGVKVEFSRNGSGSVRQGLDEFVGVLKLIPGVPTVLGGLVEPG